MREENHRSWDKERGEGFGKPVIVAGLVGFVAVAGGLVWYLCSGGESMADAIAKHRPRFAGMRAKLRRIEASLPPPGSVAGDTLPANLDPRPLYDPRSLENNTACLMAAQCVDPDLDPQSPGAFNLRLNGNDFLTHLTWTGDKNPLPRDGRDTPANEIARRFERTLGFSYLMVARVVRFDPPRALDENSFKGGIVDLEVFLVDLPGKKVLGGFRRSFKPDPEALNSLNTVLRDADVVERWVYSNVLAKARFEVAATLTRATGGSFQIEP